MYNGQETLITQNHSVYFDYRSCRLLSTFNRTRVSITIHCIIYRNIKSIIMSTDWFWKIGNRVTTVFINFRFQFRHESVLTVCNKLAVTKPQKECCILVKMIKKDEKCHHHWKDHWCIGNTILVVSCAEIVRRKWSEENDIEIEKWFQRVNKPFLNIFVAINILRRMMQLIMKTIAIHWQQLWDKWQHELIASGQSNSDVLVCMERGMPPWKDLRSGFW